MERLTQEYHDFGDAIENAKMNMEQLLQHCTSSIQNPNNHHPTTSNISLSHEVIMKLSILVEKAMKYHEQVQLLMFRNIREEENNNKKKKNGSEFMENNTHSIPEQWNEMFSLLQHELKWMREMNQQLMMIVLQNEGQTTSKTRKSNILWKEQHIPLCEAITLVNHARHQSHSRAVDKTFEKNVDGASPCTTNPQQSTKETLKKRKKKSQDVSVRFQDLSTKDDLKHGQCADQNGERKQPLSFDSHLETYSHFPTSDLPKTNTARMMTTTIKNVDKKDSESNSSVDAASKLLIGFADATLLDRCCHHHQQQQLQNKSMANEARKKKIDHKKTQTFDKMVESPLVCETSVSWNESMDITLNTEHELQDDDSLLFLTTTAAATTKPKSYQMAFHNKQRDFPAKQSSGGGRGGGGKSSAKTIISYKRAVDHLSMERAKLYLQLSLCRHQCREKDRQVQHLSREVQRRSMDVASLERQCHKLTSNYAFLRRQFHNQCHAQRRPRDIATECGFFRTNDGLEKTSQNPHTVTPTASNAAIREDILDS